MTLAPPISARCDRFPLDVYKLDEGSGASLFKAEASLFRVAVDGCQSGRYIAEYTKPEGEQPESLRFVLDLSDAVEDEAIRLCVARIEFIRCPEERAWFVSDAVEIERAGCMEPNEVDSPLPDLSAHPGSDAPDWLYCCDSSG